MDVSEWRDEARRKYPKRIKQIDFIFQAVSQFPRLPTIPQPPQVIEAEVNAGYLLVWKSPAGMKFLLSPDDQEILERGVHPWPRGGTQALDKMCKVLELNLRGDDGLKQIRAILDDGPIARQRAADEEAAERRERRLKKKQKAHRG